MSLNIFIACTVAGADVMLRNAVIPLRFNSNRSCGSNVPSLVITIGRVYPFALACSVATTPSIIGMSRSMSTIEYVFLRIRSNACNPLAARWNVNPDFLAAKVETIRFVLI